MLFSRGDDSTPATTEPAAATPASRQLATPPKAAVAPAKATLATDAERTSLTYSSYDFEVHLEPSQHSIAVQARMVARNNSDKALGRIALQLSSSLHWESMEVDGKPTKFEIETVASDIDHTGELTEAVVKLEAPLAPGASIRMNAIYSGTVVPSAERLLRLGAPAKIANSSEWDAIDPNFTALRGFGNVIWFPVSTAPVLLGQGSEMFDSVGKWKLSESNAKVSMHVLVEYLDVKPTVAFLNGTVAQPDARIAAKAHVAHLLLAERRARAQLHGRIHPPAPDLERNKRRGIRLRPQRWRATRSCRWLSFTLAADATRIRASELFRDVRGRSRVCQDWIFILELTTRQPRPFTKRCSRRLVRWSSNGWEHARRRPVVLVDLPDARRSSRLKRATSYFSRCRPMRPTIPWVR